KTSLGLADNIAHLAFCVHCPGLNSVVVLHETDDGTRLLDILHARLHIAGAVDCAAHELRRSAIPCPSDLEAREALVHDRLFEHRLAPVAAAVDRNIDAAHLAVARPRETRDFVEPR